MAEFITTIKLYIAIVGGAIAGLFGGCDMILKALICFVCVDYLTGTVRAIKERKLNSRTGFIGLLKKALIFTVVLLAHVLDEVTGIGALRSMAVLFYISNEGISILENLGKLGIPYPQKLKDILEQLEDKDDDDNKDTKSDN